MSPTSYRTAPPRDTEEQLILAHHSPQGTRLLAVRPDCHNRHHLDLVGASDLASRSWCAFARLGPAVRLAPAWTAWSSATRGLKTQTRSRTVVLTSKNQSARLLPRSSCYAAAGPSSYQPVTDAIASGRLYLYILNARATRDRGSDRGQRRAASTSVVVGPREAYRHLAAGTALDERHQARQGHLP
jgi:hypothetical protein